MIDFSEKIQVLVVGMFLFLVVFAIGAYAGYRQITHEAIKNGAAKWVCDEKTGETKFVWDK